MHTFGWSNHFYIIELNKKKNEYELISGRFHYFLLWSGTGCIRMQYNSHICADDGDWVAELSEHTHWIRYGSYLRPLFVSSPKFFTRSNDFHEFRGQFNVYPYQCGATNNGKCVAYAGENAFFLEKEWHRCDCMKSESIFREWIIQSFERILGKRRQMLHKRMQGTRDGRNEVDVCKHSTFHREKRAYRTTLWKVGENSWVTHTRLAYTEQTGIKLLEDEKSDDSMWRIFCALFSCEKDKLGDVWNHAFVSYFMPHSI